MSGRIVEFVRYKVHERGIVGPVVDVHPASDNEMMIILLQQILSELRQLNGKTAS